jgi:membrane fusion protein YbhG
VRRRAVLLLIVAALAAAGAWGWLRLRRPAPLVLSGTIEARDADVGSLVGGRVQRVEVEEGAQVEAGQAIVVLEPDLLDPQIREQTARVDAARAAHDRTVRGPRSEEVSRARVDYENAERERRRLEALLGQGVIGQQQYDDAAARAAAAFETLRQLERGSRREDLEEARANMERETQHLLYLQRQREELTVRAPAAGLVESLDLRPGDIVQAGQAVARILEPAQLWVRVFVPETRLGHVRVGQPAGITIDSFPGRTFPGEVVEIRPRGEFVPRNIQTLDQRADQVFGVKVAVRPPAPELKAGMAAFVRLGEPAPAASGG